MKIGIKKTQCLLVILSCFFSKSIAIPGRAEHRRSNAVLLATIEQWSRRSTTPEERKKVGIPDFPNFPSEELFEDPPSPTPPNSPRGVKCVRFADDSFLPQGKLVAKIQMIVEERKKLGEDR